MTLQDAIAGARKAAQESQLPIAVVNAPLENAEDESGPYGYCPVVAKDILFRFGTCEQIIRP